MITWYGIFHYIMQIWPYFIGPSGILIFTFHSPVRSLPSSWSWRLPFTASLGLSCCHLPVHLPGSWIHFYWGTQQGKLVGCLFAHDVYFCILRDQHRGWHVASVIHVCSRKEERKGRKEGGREWGKRIHFFSPPFPGNAKVHFTQQVLSLLIYISEVLNWVSIDSNNYQPV